MGCLSSKAVTRSISIRDRRNQGASVTTWEELLASHSGKDKLFSFVCSTKLTSGTFTLPSGDLQTHDPATTPDLIPEVSRKTEVVESPFGRFTRSRSCQEPRNEDVLGLDNGNDGIRENRIDWRDKNLAGSRSFHTVEEYDALLERIRKFTARNIDYNPWDDDVELPQLSSLAENQTSTEDYIKKEAGSKEGTTVDQKGTGSVRYYNDFEKAVEVDGHGETGWKRKSMAKGLKSLDVSTVEFSGIAKFRQRHHVEQEGHIYSPGTYVTPKFGSYNAKVTPAEKEKRGEEDSVFSPELVAAFEDCMQQLQEEEDNILTHMDDEYSQVDAMENQTDKVSIKHG